MNQQLEKIMAEEREAFKQLSAREIERLRFKLNLPAEVVAEIFGAGAERALDASIKCLGSAQVQSAIASSLPAPRAQTRVVQITPPRQRGLLGDLWDTFGF